MKNDKLMNAFKAFEIKNKQAIQGGLVCTWAYGGYCDLEGANCSYCNVPDPGIQFGQAVAASCY